MRRWLLLFVTMCILHVSRDVPACGIATPAGSFARMLREKTLIVWDEPSKTEHFIRKPTFDGDPASFAFFVPTPETPKVAKIDDAVFDRFRAMVYPAQALGAAGGKAVGGAGKRPGEVEVTQTVKIDDYELVSLKASDENALGDWLGKNGFVDRPVLRQWTKNYVKRGWIINAMRWAGSKNKSRALLEVPTLRLSFKIDEPFYPYSEPPEDGPSKAAFNERWCKTGDPDCSAYTTRRSLEVWMVSRKSMQGILAGRTTGPRMARSARVTNAALAEALGDSKGWFDPNAEKTWVVTHLEDSPQFWGGVLARPSAEDLSFMSYDIPPPIPMKGVEGYKPPEPPKAQSAPWMKPKADAASPHKGRRYAVMAFALFLALVVFFAIRSNEAKSTD